jgi:hypothetical protein
VNDASSSENPASAGDLTEITRLVRRICLFREQGDNARADRLQTDELLTRVAEYRLWHGPETLTDEKVCTLFVSETDHVREAMALAAALAPDLAAVVPPESPEAESVFPPMRPLGTVKPFPDQAPAVGELLDAMRSAKAPSRGEQPASERHREPQD